MKNIWHGMAIGEVLKSFHVDQASGRSSTNVKNLQEKFGFNTLPRQKRRSVFGIFLGQFSSPLIYLLLIASFIAALVGNEKDALVIIVVVILNSLVGAIQEGRAEASLSALRRLTKLKSMVLRDGQLQEINASELVPGDIYQVVAGNGVPTDGRLMEANSLQVSEASLTGESVPISKFIDRLPDNTVLPDRRNMLYAGTYVTSGRGMVVATATGAANEIGKIAAMTGKASNVKTRLEERIHNFGKKVAFISVAIFFLTFFLGVWHGMKTEEIFMIAVSQMVSIVPEGLPVAMTIALAVGVQRMAKKRTIVRKLSAVESLGSTTVICTDKTGTLTKNEMTVVEVALPAPSNLHLRVSGAGYSPRGDFFDAGSGEKIAPTHLGINPSFLSLMTAAICCNDADLIELDDGAAYQITGDPTEAALLVCAAKASLDLKEIKSQHPRRAELAFDPKYKMMATEHEHLGCSLIFVKGAPETILSYCARDNPENQRTLDRCKKTAENMAKKSLRVLAFGVIEDSQIIEGQGFESLCGRIKYLGLMGQMDPPRDEARLAIDECRGAGIRVIMVTGDHKATALAIGKHLGIATTSESALAGPEIDGLSQDQLSEKLNHICVFARVHPEQKLRIVKSLQSRGQVVAMTGDGVNDSPALAQADVGVAMGLTGTEVAKEASKIIVTDDNFETIVSAVSEGRLVYKNIKKLILFLFVTSIDELMVLLLALFSGFHAPLAAVQILWINLVSESALTASLIMEPMDKGEMRRPPIPPNDPLLDKDMLMRMPFMITASVVSTFGWFITRSSMGVSTSVVQTETFTLLVVCQWFNLLNCRSATESAFTRSILSNPWLVGGLLIANVLHGLVIYWKPLAEFFHTVPIALTSFFAIGLVASLVLWVEEVRKWWVRSRLTIRNY
jgi:magnesium-transporting ATPase (P-type)